jgi:hypothetical protein
MATAGKPLRWGCNLLSFEGVVLSASHYMVEIVGGRIRAEVEYVMDEKDAARLSTFDFTEKPGRTTTRFFSRESALAAAILAFEVLAGPGDIMTMGAYLDEVVAKGPDVSELPEDEDALTDWVIANTTSPEYDRIIGHNAPPSIIERATVIVEHEGSGWKYLRTET